MDAPSTFDMKLERFGTSAGTEFSGLYSTEKMVGRSRTMEFEISDDGLTQSDRDASETKQFEPEQRTHQIAPEAVPMRARGLNEPLFEPQI